MNHISNRIKSLALAAALLGVCGAASAQITLTGGNLATAGGTVTYNNLNAGAVSTSWNGGSKTFFDGTTNFLAFCIDPLTGGTGGVGTYTTASLNSFLNTGSPLTGYNGQMTSAGYYVGGNTANAHLTYSQQTAALVEASLTNLFSHAYADALTSNTKAAAFSYAVWEIMGESTYGRTTGALQGGGSTAANDSDATEVQIDAYLAALSSNTWGAVNGANLTTATAYTYTVYYDPTPHSAQNFIRVTTGGGGGTSVPEPASLALVGLALVGATVSRRRVRRA